MSTLGKAFQGSRLYGYSIAALLAGTGTGFYFYLRQLDQGLGITGLSQDVTWGLYIAQFTFLAGVAASMAIVTLLFYFRGHRSFGRIVLLSEFLAISAIGMSLLFVFVDVGQPMRLPNIFLHPAPGSLMFWDMFALVGYLLLSAVMARFTLRAERIGEPAPRRIKLLIVISIPWAIGMRTVSAWLYSGLPGRPLWLTAVLAPRELASALAAGPALLVILCMTLRAATGIDAGKQAIQKLARIVAYALLADLFFGLMEVFTVFYSGIPGHLASYEYLFAGMNGHFQRALWMWVSIAIAIIAVALLLTERTRKNEKILLLSSILVLVSVWIEQFVGLVVGGFAPAPLGGSAIYVPTLAELAITAGIWSFGVLMLTAFCRIAMSVGEIGFLSGATQQDSV